MALFFAISFPRTMSVSAESDIYPQLVQMAISQLIKYDPTLACELYIKDTPGTSYVVFPRNKKKYMIKLCASFWTTSAIQLTSKEAKDAQTMDGIIFVIGKRYPPVMMEPWEYTFVYVPSPIICDEVQHHLKCTKKAGFCSHLYTFYNSRIYTFGELI